MAQDSSLVVAAAAAVVIVCFSMTFDPSLSLVLFNVLFLCWANCVIGAVCGCCYCPHRLRWFVSANAVAVVAVVAVAAVCAIVVVIVVIVVMISVIVLVPVFYLLLALLVQF